MNNISEYEKPIRNNIIPTIIPDELKRCPRWVVWMYSWSETSGKWTKPPYKARTKDHASTTDPSTWVRFGDAFAAYEEDEEYAGIGFVLTPEDDFAGIDLDHCISDKGNIEPWALEIINSFDSYAEISPSGCGIRIFIRGKLPGTGRKKGGLEVYDQGRYLTVTGHHIPSTPQTVNERQAQLEAFLAEYFQEENRAGKGDPGIIGGESGIEDDEIVRLASTAQNGAKFQRLMDGDISGYPSQSEAELALCSILAFWCKKDAKQMDMIFRGSKLIRSKWDEKHGSLSYGEMTIATAIRNCNEVYAGAIWHESVAFEDEGKGIMIYLPSAVTTISKAAEQIFTLMAAAESAFIRGGKIHEVIEDNRGKLKLEIVTPDACRSRIEKLGPTCTLIMNQRGQRTPNLKRPTDEDCKGIMATTEARQLLPPIANILASPVLVLVDKQIKLLAKGYHRENGGSFVCSGDCVPDVPLAEARDSLSDLLCDFQYVSDSDRTRHLSLIISPALRFGGFIPGHCPLHSMEADQSQTGKGYALNITAAIYGEQISLVARKDGGVGSFDESLSQRFIDGRPFIQFDNLRGKLESQFLEMVLTAPGEIGCRVPHCGEVYIDPKRYFFMSTSNGLEATTDLANRSCIIRLRKQPMDYRFKSWPGGDLVEYINDNQAYYLGCIHAVIRAWWAAGAPKGDVYGHDFRQWAKIVQGIIRFAWPDAAPLLDGHREAQERTANPALTWVRNVCLALEASNRLGEKMSASALVELCNENGLEIPNLRQGADEDTAKRHIGLIMGRIMKSETLILDEFTIARSEVQQKRNDGRGYFKMKLYTIDKAIATTSTTSTTVGTLLSDESIMFSKNYREPAGACCGSVFDDPEIQAW